MAADRDCPGEIEQVKPNDDLIHQAYLNYQNDPIAMGRKVVELHNPIGLAELEQIYKTRFELQFGLSWELFKLVADAVMHPNVGGLRDE